MMTARDRDEKGAGAPWRGLLVGALGGLLASWMMNRSHALWRRLRGGSGGDGGGQDRQGGSKEEAHPPSGDDATAKTAALLSRHLLHRELTRQGRRRGGALVHYGFGAFTGALYGALGEALPLIRVGRGAPYGAAVWLLSDEIMVPLLRLSKPPSAYPPAAHAAALASHLVYGVTLEGVRRALRRRGR